MESRSRPAFSSSPPYSILHPRTGTDTFNDIKKGKWKRGRELLELVSVVVVSRPGVPYAIHEEDLVNPRCVPVSVCVVVGFQIARSVE